MTDQSWDNKSEKSTRKRKRKKKKGDVVLDDVTSGRFGLLFSRSEFVSISLFFFFLLYIYMLFYFIHSPFALKSPMRVHKKARRD